MTAIWCLACAGWCLRACKGIGSQGFWSAQGSRHWRHHWWSTQGYLRSIPQHSNQAYGRWITGVCSFLCHTWRAAVQMALIGGHQVWGTVLGATKQPDEVFLCNVSSDGPCFVTLLVEFYPVRKLLRLLSMPRQSPLRVPACLGSSRVGTNFLVFTLNSFSLKINLFSFPRWEVAYICWECSISG